MTTRRTLTQVEQAAGLANVDAWRVAGSQGAARCFSCDAIEMSVVNASTPPHAEWYLVTCAGCGLDAVLHRPMGYAGTMKNA